MKILDRGDLIRIPQDVLIWREYVSDGANLTDYKRLPQQRYGLFNEEVSRNVAEIIIDGHSWFVETEDIYEASNSH
jgi:hypothetical protein